MRGDNGVKGGNGKSLTERLTPLPAGSYIQSDDPVYAAGLQTTKAQQPAEASDYKRPYMFCCDLPWPQDAEYER